MKFMYKFILLSLILLPLVFSSTIQDPTEHYTNYAYMSTFLGEPEQNCIWAYTSIKYGGEIKIYCGDQATLGDWDKKIQSVKLRPATGVTLYENPNFLGASYTLTTNASILDLSIKNKVSSFKLKE